MSFWDKHSAILKVLACFCLLYLLVWLFYLRGSQKDLTNLDNNFNGAITQDIEKLANRTNAARVDRLLETFGKANTSLEEEFKKLSQRLQFHFPSPLIPPDTRPSYYVRVRLREERDYADQQFATVKNITLTPEARSLGMDLPVDVTEDLAQDEAWLRQIIVTRRFLDLLLALPDSDRGEPALLAVDSVRPFPPVTTGPAPAFLREYPVEAKIQISLNGLDRLLAMCADSPTLHIVRNLEINAGPGDRQSRFFSRKDEQRLRGEDWHQHYYEVRIVTATAFLLSEQEQKSQPATTNSGNTAPPTPILH